MLTKIRMLAIFFAVLSLFSGWEAYAGEMPMKIIVSVPGPLNLTYLPVDLIPKIGADKAEGAVVQVRHFGGGGVALQEMMSRNTDFAVAGLPAAMSMRAKGESVVAIAAVNDLPLFIFMVRSDLKGKVKKVSDLRGSVIGVNTSSMISKTTSQQLAELVIKTSGLSLDKVRFVPAGQSWKEQATILKTKSADAIMGDEPFASRLLAAKEVFFLTDLSNPEHTKNIPGAGFLHAALETRSDVIEREPEKVAKMVRIIRRTLQWIAEATPKQIVDMLDVKEREEKQWLVESLKKYPRMYSKDGRFSAQQMRETERFFIESNPSLKGGFRIESMLNDKWSGKKE